MIIAVPAVIPVVIPEVIPTVATDVLLLLQVPPVTASVNVDEEPAHMVVIPLIAVGAWSIVTIVVEIQPVASI